MKHTGQTNNNHSEDTIDLRELFFSLASQWKMISLCSVLVLSAGALYLRATPDTYAVNAMVQVESKKGASAALLGDLSSIMDQSSPAQAEIEILKSRMILGQVIENLNLNVLINSPDNTLYNRIVHQPKYHTEYQPNYVGFSDGTQTFAVDKFIVPEIYENQNLVLNLQDKNFTLEDHEGKVLHKGEINQPTFDSTWNLNVYSESPSLHGHYYLKKLSTSAAVNHFISSYNVAEKGKASGIIQLGYQGQDKEHLVKVLNHVLQVYSAQNIERRGAETAQTLRVLEEKLPELKAQLDESERLYNEFRSQNNTIDIKKESELFLSQTITLETKKLELEQKRAEYSAKYTNEHPMMQELITQEQSINQKLAELNSTLKEVPDLQRQHLQLYRDVEVNTQLYTNLLNSYQQLKVAKAGEIGSVRIIDTAVIPENPVKPKKAIILALSLIVGAFLGILLALAKNLLRSGIRSSEEIENMLDIPVYATVPHSDIQESRIRVLQKRKFIPVLAVTKNDDVAIESLKSVRTIIHLNLAQTKNSIINISGPAPGVGKSFISANLAGLFALDGQRTLIIDADLRRGYLHKYFGQEVGTGLTQYLLESTKLDNIISKTSIDGLDFIQRGKAASNSSELLGSIRFEKLIEELRKRYDRIIIDTPPVLAVTDAVLIGKHSDVNLLVARYAQTQLSELEITLSRFKQAGLAVNGFVLNGIKKEAGYRYGNYNYAYNYTATKDD